MIPAIIAQFNDGRASAAIKGKAFVMAERDGRLVPRDSTYPLDGPRDVAKSLADILNRKPDDTPAPKGGPLA